MVVRVLFTGKAYSYNKVCRLSNWRSGQSRSLKVSQVVPRQCQLLRWQANRFMSCSQFEQEVYLLETCASHRHEDRRYATDERAVL